MIQSSKRVAGLDVSRETMEKLQSFAHLLERWTKSINLIAPNTVSEIWTRHIVDSAQIYQFAPANWSNWTDLGSGGGLPGVIVAILDRDDRPVTLIESDQRKCLFLNTVRRELSLNLNVLNERIENVQNAQASILSSRALASLPDLLSFADRLLDANGVALFSKGARYEEELDQAKKDWHFDVSAHQSQTNSDARILEISRIRSREP
ncbi:16S rRNA (guanine(527)-N(7))-methyltransferase RsmG [Octadecabacter sp. 1_MG-2023]|uniref:16S rRNA (guanine(527)-N(7))-methyltransferase RsmG n=1 Tax=unclassified Octadecabacter TaxID=196158 RepID=UPI001C08C56C|nr:MULTISPECIES: 16S rRNA (guanine(527)-N(7))-methyltransferase RsmG [unclassified Octadecabacter]MBU2992310.1 16S rRNA (guanine(527)-N(7))-methyltransferase RsmG [Octadecabacter sp. B2R22]MDO6734933.1 16S rRNA (guanine(527)-N(7))-methyltransferase RsmG [Octadecabacter sp. 1_MG-2023]